MAKQSVKPSTKKLPAFPPNDAPLVTWAIWCADVGRLTGAWKVFPCAPGEKRPLHKGWQDEAASDRKTVETMWQNDPKANIGLAIQPGFMAVDVDDWKALEKLEDEHSDFPATYEQRTPRGGGHFVCATELDTGNATGGLPKGIDIRGCGGYIVGAGSVFVEKGKEVGRWSVDNATLPAPLPRHIEAMLKGRKRRDPSEPDDPVPGVTVDEQRNVQYFADWCAGKPVRTIATPKGEVAKPCIEEQGGNNMLAATGAVAHDYGLSEDVGYVTALEHHNPRCEPPWDDDEYECHFRSGYRSANGHLGSRAPARDHSHLFKPYLATDNGELVDDNASQPVSDPERDDEADRESEPSFEDFDGAVKSLATLMAMVPKQRRWLLYPFILEGFTNLWVGPGGLGKSETLKLIALLIATGTAEILGRKAARREDGKIVLEGEREPMPTLYITSEDPDEIGRERLAKMIAHYGIDPEGVPFEYVYTQGCIAEIDETGKVKPGSMLPWLKSKIESVGGRGLVILDPIMSYVRLKANEDVPVEKLFKAVLDPLCHETGATIIPVKHPSRAAQTQGQHIGGAEQWVNAPRNVVSFKTKGNKPFDRRLHIPRVVTVEKANYGGLGEELELRYDFAAELPVEASRASVQTERAAELETVFNAVAAMAGQGMLVQKRNMGSGQGPRGVAAKVVEEYGIKLAEDQVIDYLEQLERARRLRYIAGHGKEKARYEVVDVKNLFTQHG